GCVLYHALVAEAAFPEKTLSAILLRKTSGEIPDPRVNRKDLNAAIATLVRGMLAASKEDRPQSYGAVIHTCESLLQSLGSTPRPERTNRYRRPAAGTAAKPPEVTIAASRADLPSGGGGPGGKVAAAVAVL